ncbi:MAG TPA: DUF4860 domain-containing protein [Bacillota bacterium]|nr:DUF4860 domain-containing protein [Bacillota bacterium]HQC35495.1 DUF4860 domain-containing protein [Bacillota bacterium]
MKKNSPSKRNIGGLATLLTFGAFAVCILSVLLVGARAYKSLTVRDRQSFAARTASQYIITKLRQSPSPDVGLTSFGDGDCLVFKEDIEGRVYLTRVYCSDGWLCELFAEEGGDFLPSDGEKVIEASSLDMELKGGLLRISLIDGEGRELSFCVNIRGEKGGGA